MKQPSKSLVSGAIEGQCMIRSVDPGVPNRRPASSSGLTDLAAGATRVPIGVPPRFFSGDVGEHEAENTILKPGLPAQLRFGPIF
jgi:hypothetical protein